MNRKLWTAIHKWTGLISGLFLLLLFITGLPLIFREELEHLSGEIEAPELEADLPPASLDTLIKKARDQRPQDMIRFVFWDPEHHPNLTLVSMAPAMNSPREESRAVILDSRTGSVLDEPVLATGFLYIMHRLHADMFAGLPGMLFLGFMGILMALSLVSGLILYHPFMSRLAFGTLRVDKTPRIMWMDIHNLLGVTTLVWVLLVGLTGTVNSFEKLLFGSWKKEQMAFLNEKYSGIPPYDPSEYTSLDGAFGEIVNSMPDLQTGFIAFPGTHFSSPYHYTIFMKGREPLTSRLLHPVLVDAKTSEITISPEFPWYMKTLFISRPIHFGDYGGMPLKILWAVFDIAGIFIIGSGLYIWYLKHRSRKIKKVSPIKAKEDGVLTKAGAL